MRLIGVRRKENNSSQMHEGNGQSPGGSVPGRQETDAWDKGKPLSLAAKIAKAITRQDFLWTQSLTGIMIGIKYWRIKVEKMLS